MGEKGWDLIVAEVSSFGSALRGLVGDELVFAVILNSVQWCLIVAVAYATAVDLRIAIIFRICCPYVICKKLSLALHFDLRRTISFGGCMLATSESTKSTYSSDVRLKY